METKRGKRLWQARFGKSSAVNKVIGLSFLTALIQSSAIMQVSYAEDSGSSLGGSNFGSVLPRAFQSFKLDTDSDAPAAKPNLPSLPHEDQGLSSAKPAEESSLQTSAPASKTNAWYKFLDPSLNLARALEESERKRLLSIVPMPPNLGKAKAKSSDYVHTVILKAAPGTDYGVFKTRYGSLFGRSNSLILVSSTTKEVRIFNINGYERDILFKLPNGQVIAIGPGSEMIISKSLNGTELNNEDGIARRGYTKLMHCSELSMAFAQFSLPSILETAEFKHFQKTQDPKVIESLHKTAEALDSMRGAEGFHKVLSAEEMANKSKERKRQEAARQHEIASRSVPVVPPIKSKQIPTNAVSEAKPAPSSVPVQNVKVSQALKANKVQPAKAAAAKKDSATIIAQESKDKIAKENKENKAKEKFLAAKERFLASKTNISQALKPAETSPKAASKAPKSESRSIEKENESQESIASAAANKITGWVAARRDKKMDEEIDPIIPSNLPPNIRQLLISAERQEKQARDLRKKASTNKEFSEAYYLSAEQRLHLYVTAKKQFKRAAELEQLARDARSRAAIADNAKPLTQ